MFGSSLFYSDRIFDEKNIEMIRKVMYSVTTNKQKQTRLKVGCVSSFFCETFLFQKSMKSITRVVRLPSVVQSEFYEATRILFERKENANASSICSSAAASTQECSIFILIKVNTRRIRILALRWMQKSVRCLRLMGNIQNGTTVTRRAFMKLERHAGKWIITKWSLWGGVSL